MPQRPEAAVPTLQRAVPLAVLQKLHGLLETPHVAVGHHAGDDAALHQLHGALVLPHKGLNAQLHVHLALDAVVGLDAREAVVVGANDRLGLRAVLPRLLGRQHLDDLAHDIHGGGGVLVDAAQLLLPLVARRRQKRHDERGQKQRAHDDAAGEEDQQLALGEGHVGRPVDGIGGNGEHDGERDGALGPAKRRDERAAQIAFPEPRFSSRRTW